MKNRMIAFFMALSMLAMMFPAFVPKTRAADLDEVINQNGVSSYDIEEYALVNEPTPDNRTETETDHYSIERYALINSAKQNNVSNYPYPQLLDYTDLDNSFNSIARQHILPAYQDYVLRAIKYHIESSTGDYRVAKNLLQLYGSPDGNIVFFFDGCSTNLSGATYTTSGYMKNGSRYNTSAVCIVVRKNGAGRAEIVYATKDASTMPDNVRNETINPSGNNPTIQKDGIYNIKLFNHLGHAAFQIETTWNSGLRCCGTGNRKQSTFEDQVSGIDIHARGRYSSSVLTGATYSSVGCFNVGAHNSTYDFTDYNNFIRSSTGFYPARSTNSNIDYEYICPTSFGYYLYDYVGVTIIDRSNYYDALKTIYGNDSDYGISGGWTAAQIADSITAESMQWHNELEGPPTITSITPSKSFAYVGENVTFTIGAENWTLNYYSIVLNGVGIVAQSDIDSNVFSYTFTQAGTYTIEADSWNSAGTTHLPAIQYTVVGTPTVTSITPSKSFAYVGENVTFTLGAENWTLNYYSIVLNGVGALAQSEINSNVFSYTFTQAGSYTIEADSWNPAGTTHLPAIQYTVVGAPIIDSITASQSSTYVGDTVTFTMNATNAEMYAFAIGDGTNVLQDLVFQQENTFVWTFSYAGTYFIWGAVHNGFETTYTKPEQVYTIVVSPIAEKSSVTNVEVNGSSVMVHFTPAAGAESYNIYLQKEGQSTPEYQALDVVNTISYTFTGVSDGTYNAYIISKPYKDFNEQKSSYYLFAVNTQVTTYTVTYDANGGTGAPAMQTKMQGEALTLSTAKPTREGYTFLGWAENADAAAVQYQPGDSFTKDADTTLYAVWEQDTDADLPQMIIETVMTTADSTITLEVGFSEPVVIKSILLEDFTYDKSALTLISAKWNLSETSIANWDASEEVAVAAFDENTEVGGTIFTLTFKVAADAEGDYEIGLTPAIKRLDGKQESVVEIKFVSGTIKVTKYERGDLNGDGYVTSDDAIYLLRHTLNASRYPINQSGDVNGDGYVTSDDAIYLLRHTLNPTRYPLK